MLSRPKGLGLALLLTTSIFASSCTVLVPTTECIEVDKGKPCRDMYRSTGVSGSVVTADGSIGVYALASVSLMEHGSLALTFFRLTDSRDPVSVRTVRLLTSQTMKDGRAVQFNDAGVSNTVSGEFQYSTYFPVIPIQVEFSSGSRTWSRELELRPSYAPNYFKGIDVEPKAPKTVAEFRALQRPTSEQKPRFATTEQP